MTTADLQIVYRDPAALRAYGRNSRTHTAEQIAAIRRSIDEFGFVNPILLKDDQATIGAGHARLSAALLDPPLERVPTVLLEGLTDAQWRAYVIADNRLAEQGSGWDFEALRLEIADLKLEGFNIDLTGFSITDLRAMDAAAARFNADPDDAPEPPPIPTSLAGDLWLLGDHRLLCGDSTSATDVVRLLAGETPFMMVTDPPYGVNYDADWRNSALRKSGKPMGGRAVGKVTNDDRADWREAWALFPGAVAYVWHGGLKSGIVAESLEAMGLQVRAQLIWRKSIHVVGRAHYHWRHEPCWYAVRKGSVAKWCGGRSQDSVWDIDKPAKSETGHSTQKPVECMRRPMENHGSAGDAVYDPFLGSGTSLVAAEMVGKRCLGMELSPAYVDVCVLRWQTFTGKEATLSSTGLPFAEVQLARRHEKGAIAKAAPKAKAVAKAKSRGKSGRRPSSRKKPSARGPSAGSK